MKGKFTLRSWQRLLSLVTLLFVGSASLSSWAQLDESKTYYIKTADSGLVVSNQESFSNNARIVVEEKDTESTGQKWKLKKAAWYAEVYLILSAADEKLALDIAPTGPFGNYVPVHWTADINSLCC